MHIDNQAEPDLGIGSAAPAAKSAAVKNTGDSDDVHIVTMIQPSGRGNAILVLQLSREMLAVTCA